MGEEEISIETLQLRIGYHFVRTDILMEALTHRSFSNESPGSLVRDNQRLEFFGDAVVGYIVSHLLLERFPDSREGQLSRLRASLVHEERLASLARSIGLGQFVRLGRGEERAGGRERSSLLADAYEALLGAVCLDGGEGEARLLVEKHFVPLVDSLLKNNVSEDFKSLLQEQSQGRGISPPTYQVKELTGPSHAPRFVVEVVVDGTIAGSGEGKSKKEAEQAAARSALRHT